MEYSPGWTDAYVVTTLKRFWSSRRAMPTPLFPNDEATDPGYRNIRDAKKGPLDFARWHCQYLWRVFERHADKEFRKELRSTFDARYWEMYLTTSLIFAGYSVTCPKPGPDVGIIFEGQRIWFEATSPTRGAPGKPDSVGEVVYGQVPEDKITLRYLNSISTKYDEQYANWLKKGIVSDKDAFVIAINPWAIPFDRTDGNPPRILRAGYTVGAPYVEVDPTTVKAVASGYYFSNFIEKAAKEAGKDGATIPKGVFQIEQYRGLSGLLCSRAEAANRPSQMGADFQLAPNPHAAVPLPNSFRLRGVYFDVKAEGSGYKVTPT
jgi:hypothetical protein